MLPMPTSITPGHESGGEATVYADWVESSVLFSDEWLSKAVVRDFFREENTFKIDGSDQMVDDVWNELVRRRHLLQTAFPVKIAQNRVSPVTAWQACPAYAFCLLLSYAKSNAEWEHQSCKDYQIQGELFEHIAAAALKKMLAVWNVERIGWSQDHPETMSTQIVSISERLHEKLGGENPTVSDKDGGVDIMCYRAFTDQRGNYPVFFVQCATGRNWTEKRAVDTLNLWRNWISFRSGNLLSRGFAVPFSLCDEAFRQTQMRVDGLILDRIRLFSHDCPESKWLPEELRKDITSWIGEKLNTLSED